MSTNTYPRIERLWGRSFADKLSPMMSVAASAAGCCPYVPKTSCVLHGVQEDPNDANRWALSMPDKASGHRVVHLQASLGALPVSEDERVALAAPTVVVSSVTDAIPSSRTIGCLTSLGDQRMLVADDLGNVYLEGAGDDGAAAAKKRLRTEAQSSTTMPSSWERVASAAQAEPMRGGLPSLGASGGWVGVASIGAAPASKRMVCSREHFLDSRVLDVPAGAVVRSFYHMHAPTSVTTVAAIPDAFLTAEGPILATYDVRCAQRVASHRVSLSSGSMYTAAALGTTRPHEVVSCQADRSVVVWDVRTWGRVRTIPSVLKYVVMSVTPIYGGDYIVCTGIDAEVRVVATAAPAKESAGSKKPPSAAVDAAAPGASSFRNRINETEHCESVWHGAWAPIANAVGAVGLAMSNECYVVR